MVAMVGWTHAILVGHSSGGMIITEAAEKRPDCVKVLVYLSAFLLPPNSTPRDVMLADAESILQSCLHRDNWSIVSWISKPPFYPPTAADRAHPNLAFHGIRK